MKITAAAVGIALAAVTMTACGSSKPFDPCTVNPTRQAQDGTWLEADGEPLDSDPCDSDDFDSNGHRKPGVKKPSTAKPPAPKVTTGTGRNTTGMRR